MNKVVAVAATRVMRTRLALYGAIGAVAPDILILYSKRFSMPAYTFVTWKYFAVTGIYMCLAATVTSIAPLKGPGSEWKAFGIGFGLPVFLAALASVARPNVITPRGDESLPGTLLDLASLF